MARLYNPSTQLNNEYDVIKIKIRCCNIKFNPTCHKVAHREFHFLLFNKAIWDTYWKEDVWLLSIALQSNIAQTIEELFA